MSLFLFLQLTNALYDLYVIFPPLFLKYSFTIRHSDPKVLSTLLSSPAFKPITKTNSSNPHLARFSHILNHTSSFLLASFTIKIDVQSWSQPYILQSKEGSEAALAKLVFVICIELFTIISHYLQSVSRCNCKVNLKNVLHGTANYKTYTSISTIDGSKKHNNKYKN